MTDPTLSKCGGCVVRQAELDAVAEIVGPSMLAECDGYVYEAVHRIQAQRDSLMAENQRLQKELDRWKEVASDLQETNDERRERLDIAADRDSALCAEVDDLRAKVVDLERERDDARKAHAEAVARWTESRQEALRMRLGLCNALSDDCESTCGLPLDDDRECPEHGPVIGGGRIE